MNDPIFNHSALNDFENKRRGLERYADWIYYALTIAGGLVMLALAWRIDTPLMRAWSLIAAFALVASSVIWLKATLYAAPGGQLTTARIFLGVDWAIALLNTVALFFVELAPGEAQTVAYGLIHYWAIIGSAFAVMSALIGVGFLRMFSPDRVPHDLARKYRGMMFGVLEQSMSANELPEDLKAQMLRDSYAALQNVIEGVGQNTIDYTRALIPRATNEASHAPRVGASLNSSNGNGNHNGSNGALPKHTEAAALPLTTNGSKARGRKQAGADDPNA